MTSPERTRRRLALVAHDQKKLDLIEWAAYNREVLAASDLVATGTTGTMLTHEVGLEVQRLQSGPLGGDQQLGAMVAEQLIDALFFFWDPLAAQPHDPDVKALLRLASVWNIPMATNLATADFLISSPLMHGPYRRVVPDYGEHARRTPAVRAGL